jgi:hypothetical protein
MSRSAKLLAIAVAAVTATAAIGALALWALSRQPQLRFADARRRARVGLVAVVCATAAG